MQMMKAAPKLFRELDLLVKAIGECKSKAEEDRIISAEVDVLKQRLADPRLDKSRGREYMVRVMYCEMLGHDASWAYIPALQLASDPSLLTKKVRARASCAGGRARDSDRRARARRQQQAAADTADTAAGAW